MPSNGISREVSADGDIVITVTLPDAVSEEWYCKLVDLAVERIADAERCAGADCSPRLAPWPELASKRRSWPLSVARTSR
jgi:hypothetical protein